MDQNNRAKLAPKSNQDELTNAELELISGGSIVVHEKPSNRGSMTLAVQGQLKPPLEKSILIGL